MRQQRKTRVLKHSLEVKAKWKEDPDCCKILKIEYLGVRKARAAVILVLDLYIEHYC